MIWFRAAFRQVLRYHFPCIIRAEVAQVVERSPEKAGVGGSTPSLGTTPLQSRFGLLPTIASLLLSLLIVRTVDISSPSRVLFGFRKTGLRLENKAGQNRKNSKLA
jgi:hypothetical protein